MRWAIGAIAAVLSTMVFLPGIASAHHLEYDETIVCDNGSFQAKITYDARPFEGENIEGGIDNMIIVINIEGEQFDGDPDSIDDTLTDGDADGSLSADMAPNVEVDDLTADNDFNFSPTRDRFEVDGHPNSVEDGADDTDYAPDFLVISGNYGDVGATDDDEINVHGEMYNASSDADLDNDPLSIASNSSRDATLDPSTWYLDDGVSLDDFQKCITDLCIDGEFDEILEFQGEDTGDCGRVNVCFGDNTYTVSEHDLEEQGLEEGECGPPPPPDTPPPPTVTTAPPVQEVAAAISEVLPARLPSTGMGPDASSSSFSLVAVLAVTLLSIGGVATVVARRSRS